MVRKYPTQGEHMKFCPLFFFSIFFVTTVNGSVILKNSNIPETKILFAKSAEGTAVQLDAIWAQESQYVAQQLRENDELGTEKEALTIPLTKKHIEELEGHLLMLKKNNIKQLKRDLMSSISMNDRNTNAFYAKARELHELFKAIKLMGLKKLQPIVLAGFLFLLKRETALDAFVANPSLIKELELPSEVAQSLVKIVSDEDQEFLRSYLCITLKSQKQLSHLTISSCGRYLVTAGNEKKDSSYFEIFDTINGDSLRYVPLTYKIQGIHICQDNQILTWGKNHINLWDSLGTHNCTPDGWKDLIKESKKILGTALSFDKKSIALVLDDKILVLSIPKTASSDLTTGAYCKTLTAPSMHKKENKKKSHSEIVFGNDDQILIEVRPGGDLLFYRWEAEKCIAYKKGSGSNIKRYYINGSKFITISDAHEARVWDCQQDKVDPLNEGTISTKSRDFVLSEQFVELEKNHSKVFCDTTSKEFIDKLAFLTGTTMSSAVTITNGIGEMQVNDERGDRVQRFALPSKQLLQRALLSRKGNVFVGVTHSGMVRIWHINNPDVLDFLTSSMPLEQALFVQCLMRQLRNEPRDIYNFLEIPHMKRIFGECNKTFRTLITNAFSDLSTSAEVSPLPSPRNRASDYSVLSLSSSSSNQKLFRTASQVSTSTQSPQASPRGHKPSPLAAISSLSHVESLGTAAVGYPRQLSTQDSSTSISSTPRELSKNLSLSRTSASSGALPVESAIQSHQKTSEVKNSEVHVATFVEFPSQEEAKLVELPDSSSDDKSLGSNSPAAASLNLKKNIAGKVSVERVSLIEETSSMPSSSVPIEEKSDLSPVLERYTEARSLYEKGEYDRAFQCFLTMHENSTSKLYKACAAHFLGEMCLEGRGTDHNPPLALTFFEKAAKQSVDKALQAETFARLGELYSYGYGVKQSQMKALYNLNQVIAYEQDPSLSPVNGDATFRSKISALFLLHRAKSKGLGIHSEVDAVTGLYDEALQLCERMCNTDSKEASRAYLYKGRLLLARLKGDSDTANKAWRCLLKAAESSDELIKAEAFYRLGKVALTINKSIAQAKEYFEKSLKVKASTWVKPMVELYLGHVYRQEESAKKTPSYTQAIEHYEQALKQAYNLGAHYESAYYLARMYELSGDPSLSKEASWKKVFNYDMQAIAVGEVLGVPHIDAHFSLARQYYNGTLEVAIDLHEAYKHFMIVAKESHSYPQIEESWFSLAEMSQKGRTIKKDRYFALQCYEKILSLREEAGYISSNDSIKFFHKALLEVARHEVNAVKYALTESNNSDSESASGDISVNKLERVDKLLNEILQRPSTQEEQREAKLLQAELNKLRK
jgi:TPR repeat protein